MLAVDYLWRLIFVCHVVPPLILDAKATQAIGPGTMLLEIANTK